MKTGDIKKEDVDLVRKNIVKGIKEGKNIKNIEKELKKTYPKELVEYLTREAAYKKESDTDWLKNYREKVESKKRSEDYQRFIGYALTSIFVAGIIYYTQKQFEKFLSLEYFGSEFSDWVLALKLGFWISITVFIASLAIASHKRYKSYKEFRIKSVEAKLKEKDKTEQRTGDTKKEPEPEPKEKKNPETKPASIQKEERKPAPVPTKQSYTVQRYKLSPQLREKLKKMFKKKVS